MYSSDTNQPVSLNNIGLHCLMICGGKISESGISFLRLEIWNFPGNLQVCYNLPGFVHSELLWNLDSFRNHPSHRNVGTIPIVFIHTICLLPKNIRKNRDHFKYILEYFLQPLESLTFQANLVTGIQNPSLTVSGILGPNHKGGIL